MKNALVLCLCCWAVLSASAQVRQRAQPRPPKRAQVGPLPAAATVTIQGEITGKTIADDSLFFVRGEINQKYFARPIPPARITNNAFRVAAAVAYPQMWRILLKSDKPQRIYRDGEYFIDAATSRVTADYLAPECNQVNGATATEYRTRFIPYFSATGTPSECHQAGFDKLARDRAPGFDSTLYRYVQVHPASYVALWSLIERFSKFGHSQLREQTVALFASQVKASTPWQVLQTDMQQILLKQGAPFPSFQVQGVTQHTQPLPLPKAQYTLVDFWFSHCRPCLESFPALKDLYATYQAKGFEIVSITTDPTEDIPLWHKRLTTYALPWPQYLDENAVAATKLKVHIFPATFLLDRNGNVVLRDITPEELAKFLATKLDS
jgi:thiol-disulfide isomerase/thioredoxin